MILTKSVFSKAPFCKGPDSVTVKSGETGQWDNWLLGEHKDLNSDTQHLCNRQNTEAHICNLVLLR